MNSREARGYAIIAKGDTIEQVNEGIYRVPSQNGNGPYSVTVTENERVCTCPDYTYRHEVVGDCKHIFAVVFYLQVRAEAHEVENAKVRCKWCNSLDIIRYGHESGKQVFKCMDCLRKFVSDNPFAKTRYDPQIITVTLDLYFKGSSFRKISDHLAQFYGVKVGYSTLYYWIDRYVAQLSDYVSKLKPQLGGQWHADEMMVKCAGEWHYLWNIMDKDTRFMLASQITKGREVRDASRLFAKAKRIAKALPRTLVTDGLTSYQSAWLNQLCENGKPRPRHIRKISFAGQHNNNLVERLNGTKRERDKVLRGMKKKNTPIRKGFDLYYNFIRPHQGLEGKTPAEMAGISLEQSGNRWMALLEKAKTPKVEHRDSTPAN